jgi:hypothetical protein
MRSGVIAALVALLVSAATTVAATVTGAFSTDPGYGGSAVSVTNAGNGDGVLVRQSSPASASNGLEVISTNQAASAAGISGTEAGRGTLKVTHNYPGTPDTNASALSVSVSGAGTAAQGIFLDAPSGTTGKLLNIRNSGAEKLTLYADGRVDLTEQSSCTAPAAGRVRLCVKVGGALVAKYPDGHEVTLAQ